MERAALSAWAGDHGGLLRAARPGPAPPPPRPGPLPCRPGSVMERAAVSAWRHLGAWVLAGLGQRLRHRGQGCACRSGSVMERAQSRPGGTRLPACWPAWASASATAARACCLPVRVGDGAGQRLSAWLLLAGLGQRLRHRGQGCCLPVRVGDGAGDGLGLGGTSAACSCWPAWASASPPRSGLRLPVRVGDGAGDGLGLRSCWPAWASACATAARAAACWYGSVMERATVSAWRHLGACRAGRPGPAPPPPRPGLRLPVRVGDGAGHAARACSCWPAWASASATAVRACCLPVRVGDGAGGALGLGGHLGGLRAGRPGPAPAPPRPGLPPAGPGR